MSFKPALASYTVEQLQSELERRKKLQENIPQPLPNPDFSKLIKLLQEYLSNLAKTGYKNDDTDHYTYEIALECVYGKGVWEWVNENTQ